MKKPAHSIEENMDELRAPKIERLGKQTRRSLENAVWDAMKANDVEALAKTLAILESGGVRHLASHRKSDLKTPCGIPSVMAYVAGAMNGASDCLELLADWWEPGEKRREMIEASVQFAALAREPEPVRTLMPRVRELGAESSRKAVQALHSNPDCLSLALAGFPWESASADWLAEQFDLALRQRRVSSGWQQDDCEKCLEIWDEQTPIELGLLALEKTQAKDEGFPRLRAHAQARELAKAVAAVQQQESEEGELSKKGRSTRI